MKITWLGQAGLLFERGGVSVMIDPYLSNYVEKVQPANYRRSPINEAYFNIDPDIMIFTHDHIDHYDPETAPVFFKKSRKPMSVLGPTSVRAKAMGDLCGQKTEDIRLCDLRDGTIYTLREDMIEDAGEDIVRLKNLPLLDVPLAILMK